MINQIRFITNGNETDVYTPYNTEFVSQIKSKLGTRKYDREKGCWTINTEDLDIVKKIILNVYGYTEDDDTDRVKVKITFNDNYYELKNGICIADRTLARAFHRDSGAKLGDGVTLLEGKIGSCGSRANWETYINDGSVFLTTLPRKFIESMMNGDISIDPDVIIEIIEDEEVDRKKLEVEKEHLLVLIAEIDKILEGLEIDHSKNKIIRSKKMDRKYINEIEKTLYRTVYDAIESLGTESSQYAKVFGVPRCSNDDLLELYNIYSIQLLKINEKFADDSEHQAEILYVYKRSLFDMEKIVNEIIKRAEKNSLDCNTKEYKDVLEQAKKTLHDIEEK